MSRVEFSDLTPYASAAPLYLERGWWPLPLLGKGRGMGAVPKGYTGRTGKPVTAVEVQAWVEEKGSWNLGLRLPPTVIGVDMDCYSGKRGAETVAELEAHHGGLPPTWSSTSREDGSKIRFYSKPEEIKLPGVAGPGVEIIQFHHRYAVAWPSRHPDTGSQYHWLTPKGLQVEGPPLLADLTSLPVGWHSLMAIPGPGRSNGGRTKRDRDTAYTDPDIPMLVLQGIPDGQNQDETLRDVCWKLKLEGRPDEEIRTFWDAIVAKTPLTRPDQPWTDEDFSRHMRGTSEKLADHVADLKSLPDWDGGSGKGRGGNGTGGAGGSGGENSGDDDHKIIHVLPPPENPAEVARELIKQEFMSEGRPLLVHWRDGWHTWQGCWLPVPDAWVDAKLWHWTERSVYLKKLKKKVEYVPWQPNVNRVHNLRQAVRSFQYLDEYVEYDSWLTVTDDPLCNRYSSNLDNRGRKETNRDQVSRRTVTSVVSVTGEVMILDLETRSMIPSVPEFFSTYSTNFVYDPHAKCPEWEKFVKEIWVDDPPSVNLLQEWAGYLISGETCAQKMMALLGPKRSGKSTIGRVLTQLVGPNYTVSPTLSSMCERFGLQNFPGKRLAIIADARLRATAKDVSLAVSRLLMITGQDPIDVDRKNKSFWSGPLPVRVMLLSNETPRLSDSSGTIATRFLTLQLTRSWYGQEDMELPDRLMMELPGIFNWALDGYDRLRANEFRFSAPESAGELEAEMEALSSPIKTFIRDCCDVGVDQWVFADTLYKYWRAWCQGNGLPPGASNVFSRDLRAATDGHLGTRTGTNPSTGKRAKIISGITVSPEADIPEEALWNVNMSN